MTGYANQYKLSEEIKDIIRNGFNGYRLEIFRNPDNQKIFITRVEGALTRYFKRATYSPDFILIDHIEKRKKIRKLTKDLIKALDSLDDADKETINLCYNQVFQRLENDLEVLSKSCNDTLTYYSKPEMKNPKLGGNILQFIFELAEGWKNIFNIDPSIDVEGNFSKTLNDIINELNAGSKPDIPELPNVGRETLKLAIRPKP